MGYKLAGFNHMGGVEIDVPIADVYDANHHPKYLYKVDIKSFNKLDLPADLYSLDVLDGSPPCSSFSLSGNREEDWGKEKVFNEGQALQRLDDLFFDYIDTAKLLKPKVIIAENVTGMISGNARAYVYEVCKKLNAIGYKVQMFKLNAASMGVPQKRERVFFICRKKSLKWKNLQLSFSAPPILFKQVEANISTSVGKPITDAYKVWWKNCTPGNKLSSVHPIGSFFNTGKVWKNQVCPTITSAVCGKLLHYSEPAEISHEAIIACGSFPIDYDFKKVDPKYLIGMSVPPVMMANIANQVYVQWFK